MNQTKTARFSVAMFSTVLMLAFQLFSGSANAVNIPITTFSCSVNPTPTSTATCVSGFYSANWASGGYWQYELNTIGYSGTITMTFKNTKSSAPGPTTGQVQYSLTGPTGTFTNLSGGLFSVTTGCVQQSFTLPATCSGIANLCVRVVMSGATNGSATHRISSQNVFDAASAGCSGTPAGGTVTAASSPICAGSSANLTLTGATAGTGITRQWQSSPNNSTWSNIAGATGDAYTATPAATTYYRVKTKCGTNDSSFSVVDTVVVRPVNIGSIVFDNDPIGPSQPAILEAGVFNAFATYPGGIWASSNTGVASIDASGAVTPNFGGETVISYQAIDTSNGCLGTISRPIAIVWQNTIALYAGANGNSTHVINVPGDQTSDLSAVGFGSATQCGNGGLSGLTVPVADSTYDPANPYVVYKVGADAGSLLNMTRIQARLRVSSTGPTKARIAYDVHIPGSGWQGLSVEPNDHNLTDGNCGASANVFDYNTGSTVNPNPTVFGADSIEVRVYPFKPGAATGTFQANIVEVYGIITSNNPCGDLPITSNTTDSVLPALVNICDSGSRFLNYNIGSGGNAGAGVNLQWQESSDNGATWSDIPFATGAVYQTNTFHAGVGSDTMMYRVKVTCSASTGFSEPSLIAIHSTPTIAAFTGGVAATAQLPFRHMLIGTNYTLTPAVAGGTWSSNDTSAISINSASGVATPHIPGDAIITYRALVNGCTGSVKDTFVSYYPNTKALYVGRNGSSINVYAASGVSASNLATTAFGSTTACGNGGKSGLTQTTATQDVTTNGIVYTTVGGTFSVSQVRATVRMSNSGTFKTYLGYRPVGGSWNVDPSPVDVAADDCGYSHNEVVFNISPSINITPAQSYDFGVFAYQPGFTNANAAFQVNSISVIGTGTPINGMNSFVNSEVKLFPNPVTNVLNVSANEKVTVAIYSIDGKKLIEQKDAGSIDVSSLVNGMYLVQVYGEHNNLLKTDKFVKK